MYAILIPSATTAHAEPKASKSSGASEASNDPCIMTKTDIAIAKERHAKTIDYARDQISKCCREVCSFSFTTNQIEVITLLAALAPAAAGLGRSPSTASKIIAFLGPTAVSLLGLSAKAYASREVECTDELKDKKLAELRIIGETISKLNKKDAEEFCRDMQKAGDGAKNKQDQLDNVVKILRAQQKYPEYLDDLNSDCNQVSLEKARSAGCVSAIYRYCIGQGARGGIAQEVPTHSIQAVCLPRNISIIQNVSYDAIGVPNSPAWIKRKGPPSSHQSSANSICQGAGYRTGAIQDYLSDSLDVLCFNPDLITIPFAVLSQQNPRCDSIQNITHPFCSSAVHSYCVSSGLTGGLLHQKNSDGSVIVACFAGKVHNIEFSSRVPAYQ